jgi:polar amino acid transport system permease protein
MTDSTLRRIGPEWLQLRASNLVLLASAPFFIYLFATSTNYSRSLAFIVGIEEGAAEVFRIFLVLLLALLCGLAPVFLSQKQPQWLPRPREVGWAGLALHLVLMFWLSTSWDLTPFWDSVIGDLLDARSNAFRDPQVNYPALTPEGQAWMQAGVDQLRWPYLIGVAVLGVLVLSQKLPDVLNRVSWRLLLLIQGGMLAFVLLVARLSFATGLLLTLRAAIFAYLASALLGLVLAGMLALKSQQGVYRRYGGIAAVLLGIGVIFSQMPQERYVLIGTTEGRVAFIKETPQRLADTLRYGEFDQGVEMQIRAAKDLEQALRLYTDDKRISAALIPEDAVPAQAPILWRTEFLADAYRTPAMLFGVFGFLLGLLTFGGWQHRMHPLAVFAEFYIDILRGIPMLVIILYVGLPLSGAVKQATDGFIDLPNMIRGVFAICLGYSAYMAEIFRAGIEAVPRGQIEAARSLGLDRWQTARLVILPQALRIVIPPLGNEFIAMLKDTALLSILSVRDATQRMREFQASSFLPFAPFNTAAILYVVLTLAAASLLKWLERRTTPIPKE